MLPVIELTESNSFVSGGVLIVFMGPRNLPSDDRRLYVEQDCCQSSTVFPLLLKLGRSLIPFQSIL